ncbi:hypothetical protein SPRG_09031 [Saprolegnia parasitica CBS 223.65]|uniref:Fe2OG dioxygenase domain-containing protein n=1 Tax=Saprolegnia parasitica (strain CBS 223.65) TaxID=695850 RepID=A0A067CG15_SAPPC|nr:hypothetical protein SPRG_09031 [Saprolegnia parasitica CBS 223.65]KDO25732.1 hypothetical protein SPRG_09031 [Saprolegnia parasitica CBS 223.65]|eukprot:XP_012203542.1 hypothetical protein SPRG_09031 [Saprolegnia parasitica CBS 223.65]
MVEAVLSRAERRQLKKKTKLSSSPSTIAPTPTPSTAPATADASSTKKKPSRRAKKRKRPMGPSSAPITSLDVVAAGGISVTTQWIAPHLVERLRADATALRAAGAFTKSTIGGRVGESQKVKRSKRLSECCGLFDDAAKVPRDVGDVGARDCVMDLISDLHATLNTNVAPLGDEMELQYLYYPGDDEGFYGKHIDQQERIPGKPNRVVSMVLYLNAPDWESSRDGGNLCAYPTGAPPVHVDPIGGTLVVFHSEKLIHEARPTKRDRWALVGWFMEAPTKRHRV